MQDQLHYFWGISGPQSTFSLEEILKKEHTDSVIITCYEGEDEYFRGLRLIMGGPEIVTFKEFHDQIWDQLYNRDRESNVTLYKLMQRQVMYCSSKLFMDYITSPNGEQRMAGDHRRATHWSRAEHQQSMFMWEWV